MDGESSRIIQFNQKRGFAESHGLAGGYLRQLGDRVPRARRYRHAEPFLDRGGDA